MSVKDCHEVWFAGTLEEMIMQCRVMITCLYAAYFKDAMHMEELCAGILC